MNKDRIERLKKYVALMQERLSGPTPSKHATSPQTYRQFLEREIDFTKRKIRELEGL